MKRLVLALLGIAGLVAAASAQDITGITLHQVGTTEIGSKGSFTPFATTATSTVYSNITNYLGLVVVNGGAATQAGNGITRLVADDLTPAAGFAGLNVTLITFSVGNLNATTVTARPRVRFYLADGAGGGPGTVITGFSFNPIAFPAGASLYNFNPGGAVALPLGTFWAGMTFDNNTGATGATLAQLNNLGQAICDPPTVGTSADVLFQTTAAGSFLANNPAGGFVGFGGNPVANVAWAFDVEQPVPAMQSTWGRVKALYK